MSHFVYILTNKDSRTLYIGVTNNIQKRVYEHRNGLDNSFTRKYRVSKLIHYEEFKDIKEAISREKQLKNWHRSWKINLIRSVNPNLIEMLK